MDEDFGEIDDTPIDNSDFSSDSGDSFDDGGSGFDDTTSDFGADDGLEFDDSGENFDDGIDDFSDDNAEGFEDDTSDFDEDDGLEFDDSTGDFEDEGEDISDDNAEGIEDDTTDFDEDDGLEFDDSADEFEDEGEEVSDDSVDNFEDDTDEGFDEDTDNPDGWDTPIDETENMDESSEDDGLDYEDDTSTDDDENPEGWDTPIDETENMDESSEDDGLDYENDTSTDDEENPEGWDTPIDDTENNDMQNGYLDDDNKWHGSEEDEPLFGEDGELRDLNEEEIPLTDDEKENPEGWDTPIDETENTDESSEDDGLDYENDTSTDDEENPEGWDTPIDDTENNDMQNGYLDDDNKWHGSEEDEPLFGEDGELRDLNEEEIPLTDDEKENPKGLDTPIDDTETDDMQNGYLDDDNKWHGSEEDEPLFGEDGELRDLNEEEIPLTDEKEIPLTDDETENMNNEDLYEVDVADKLPPDDPSKPKHDIPNETEIMTADPDNVHIDDDSLLNNNNTDYTNDTIDGNGDFNKGRYDVVDNEKPISENDVGNSKDINIPENNENISDTPKRDTEKEKKGNIFDRLFKGKNKANNDVPNSNIEIDDNADKNEFLGGIKSQVQDRKNVENSDANKIENGTWDTNTHKPGGIARTRGKINKTLDVEDETPSK